MGDPRARARDRADARPRAAGRRCFRSSQCSLNLLTAAATFGVMTLLFGGAHPPLGGPGYLDPMSIIGIFTAVFGDLARVPGRAAGARPRRARGGRERRRRARRGAAAHGRREHRRRAADDRRRAPVRDHRTADRPRVRRRLRASPSRSTPSSCARCCCPRPSRCSGAAPGGRRSSGPRRTTDARAAERPDAKRRPTDLVSTRARMRAFANGGLRFGRSRRRRGSDEKCSSWSQLLLVAVH